MASEEALRAAAVINSVLSASAGRWPTEARIAEIIDRKFAALREAHIAIIEDRTLAYAKLAEAEEERDKLRGERDKLLLALGPRGWHDCSACKGCGGSWKRRQWVECECRKGLGL